jgi:hypothetical protein
MRCGAPSSASCHLARAQDTNTFVDSLNRARWVFNQMEDLGVKPWLLDIGGGFPGTDAFKVSFAEIAAVIRPVIDELFPPHVTVISEPGRYFCAGSHTLAANMYARREIKLPSEKGEAVRTRRTQRSVAQRSPHVRFCAQAVVVAGDDSASAHATNPLDSSGETTSSRTSEPATAADSSTAGYKYYLNDGVYGSFNCIFFGAHSAPIHHSSARAIRGTVRIAVLVCSSQTTR